MLLYVLTLQNIAKADTPSEKSAAYFQGIAIRHMIPLIDPTIKQICILSCSFNTNHVDKNIGANFTKLDKRIVTDESICRTHHSTQDTEIILYFASLNDVIKSMTMPTEQRDIFDKLMEHIKHGNRVDGATFDRCKSDTTIFVFDRDTQRLVYKTIFGTLKCVSENKQ